jgi:hypothetical protein
MVFEKYWAGISFMVKSFIEIYIFKYFAYLYEKYTVFLTIMLDLTFQNGLSW